MNYLPIFIDVRARACLVVGGGQVALRKVELLRSAGAVVHVVAREVCAELETLASAGQLHVERRAYAARDVEDKWLVVAATDDEPTNARVAADATAGSIPVNVVDSPALCTFVMPAIIDRSPVLVAVSTAGASPVLARLTRARIELALPARLGQLAEFAARFRAGVKARIADPVRRRTFWESVLDGQVGDLVLDGRGHDAERAITERLEHADAEQHEGRVTLLATGDGDVDRLSLRAARALGSADLLMHESSVLPVVQALARRDAERTDIGRLSVASDGLPDALRAALVATARQGRHVCVVLAGDPYTAPDPPDARALREAGVGVRILRFAP